MKTKEDLAKVVIGIGYWEHMMTLPYEQSLGMINEMFNKAFKAGYEAGQPKWVSVEERLPQDNVEVLVYSSLGDDIQFGVWEEGVFRSIHDHLIGLNLGITHWMPIPTLPKEK